MNKAVVLIVGLALIYLATSGRLQNVWAAIIAPNGKTA